MQFDELHIVFTLFKTALSQIPTSDIILPVEPPEKETGATKKSVEYLFLPEAEEILKVLAPRYLETTFLDVSSRMLSKGNPMTKVR